MSVLLETVLPTEDEKSTFILKIEFHQNGSWQGTIQWTQRRKTQRFRSALELIKLIDEANPLSEKEKDLLAEWTAQDEA